MERKIPNNFSQIIAVTKFELIKYLRGKKIHSIFGIVVAIPLLLILVPELLGAEDPETEVAYLTGLVSVIFFLIVIITSFFGSGTLVSEFHDRTAYVLFPNPINRTSIWTGKFIAAELVSFATIGIFYTVISVITFYKYENLPNEIFISLIFSFIVATSIMSIAFFASSIFRSPLSAVVVVILLLIVLLPLVDQLQINLADTKPWYTPSFSSGIIRHVLTVPYPIDVNPDELPRGPFDTERYVPYLDQSILVHGVFIFVCSISSLVIFKAKEVKS